MTPYRRWRPEFEKAIDGAFYDISYLDYLVEGCGLARVWPGRRAAIVTEFKYYPRCKAIHGLIAAGDLTEITDVLIPAAEDWGRELGCAYAIIESRPGWQRHLKASGYAPHQIALAKEL